ncbi:GNAT family N-acetyltransferase [Ornithinibacillus scapharcae]|uniref:GNAT family N-acetyltransferase n=1 Tax=Ornithinibacillus scapharcae TaxID=1147159 RepID=UPI000225B5E9|nr:GNAT family N-acetyltransferase [Ornithinibacillus scapharcae]
MKIQPIELFHRDKIVEFFTQHWGSPEMVISTGRYDCSTLDGFVAVNDEDQIIGLITYIQTNNECEIISLDSIIEGKGIGTLLIQEVEKVALQNNCNTVKLITTNDNLLALKFYQKKGYVLSNIFHNAVEKAREIKPEIPFIGNDGIPIRDEIELKKVLV